METISCKVTPSEKAVLSALADERGMSLSQVMREILTQHDKREIISQLVNEVKALKAEIEVVQQGMGKQAASLASLVMTNPEAVEQYRKFLDEPDE